MKVLTADEMRATDRAAIEEWGIPSLVLMENAALGVVEAICTSYPRAEEVLVFCGPGNNGGDGFAVARHLTLRGFGCRVVTVGWAKNRSDDAETQCRICTAQGLPIIAVETSEDLAELQPRDLRADLWLDALFGTGLSRPLEGVFAEAVELLSCGLAPVVAVDLPSGLDASTGRLIGPVAAAALTVTFAALKRAHVLTPAASVCGEIVVADLGVPEAVIEESPSSLELLVGEEMSACLLEPEPEDHKGRYGHCLIVAGSTGKGGAAALAARGAVAGGAGLVTVAVPAPLTNLVDGASLESMTLPLSSDRSGFLTVDAAGEALEALEGKNVLAIGPGLGTAGTTVEAIRRLVVETETPLVIDADGVNALAGRAEILAKRGAPTVLTPHPGEAARLFETDVADIQADRIEFARRAASEHGVVLVLKGHQTLIASPEGEVYMNSTGNPGMASGGSGDVLTGIVAALLARNYDAVVAACLAVYVHGLAGDIAAQEAGLEGLRAGDLVEAVPAAYRRLRQG